MSYPLVLLGGIALGSGILSIQVPQQQASAASAAPKRLTPARGRLSAESPELRDLRAAEASLFPDVGSRDMELSSPEFWDEVLKRSQKGEAEPGGSAVSSNKDDVFEGLRMPAGMPIRRHARIAKYIEYFTSTAKGRKLLMTWMRRSGRYEDIVEGALRTHELPIDLRSVVYIESGFWPTARSSAGAVGLWQFMPQTARAYGLFVDKSIDERRSIWRASEAAAQHLNDLHERFHSWDLALAAYNMGYKQLLSRMQELGIEDYWSLSELDGALPRETALYVPKVLAIAVILNNVERFQLNDVERMPALRASEIRVPPGVRMSLIARAAGTSLSTIQELNPELRLEVVPDRGGPIGIHIPSQGLTRAKTMLPRLLQEDDAKLDTQVSPEFDWGEQELDTDGNKSRLEKTAPQKRKLDGDEPDPQRDESSEPKDEPKNEPKDGTDFSRLFQAPKKPKSSLLGPARAPGRLFELTPLPVRAAELSNELAPSLLNESFAAVRPIPAAKLKHRVQPGETIWKLSAVYGIPRWRIIYDNGLRHPDALSIGRQLVINTPEFKDSREPPEEPSPEEPHARR
jgi:membrane-bound lytic murein transglycosylase D